MTRRRLQPRRPARGQELVESYRLLRELCAGWRQVTDLAATTEIHLRTVYRRIKSLEASGVEVERKRERGYVWLHVRRERAILAILGPE